MTELPSPPPPTIPDSTLSLETAQWLTGLPPEILPRRMAVSFPHVANRIATLWRSPTRLDRYFEELIEDRRGGRSGFPLGVALEIAGLRDYYQSAVYPVKSCMWNGRS